MVNKASTMRKSCGFQHQSDGPAMIVWKPDIKAIGKNAHQKNLIL
eukprot:CAMPEP_0172829534 /NCGR_PEP_ID=MMETSP1075-20121228/21600_1 /TAXON_ID=2916 /ORGANISM="Ceratium fusus, Strain PA161109" /LENGTH=44 /DNA_ID= /DNA_START= /DNA_END= /DNA_ORIENTATION=